MNIEAPLSNSANHSVALLGVPVDRVTMDMAVQRIDWFIRQGGFHQIATANADYLVRAVKDPELCEILSSCDLVVADGMPLVWASRALGNPLPERVAGADLVPRLAELSHQKGYRIFLLGASPDSSERAAEYIKTTYPRAQIVGRSTPDIGSLDEFDNEPLLNEIKEANPDILLVAFGNPKQEKWIYRNRHRLSVPVCIGVGGSLDFLAGRIPRAPRWMQSTGCEWIYRMWQEPRRLAGRYAKDGWGLVRYLTVQLVMTMLLPPSKRSGEVAVESVGTVHIVSLKGGVTGSVSDQLEATLRSASRSGGSVIIDLSKASRLGADALATLVRAGQAAKSRGVGLWLTGVSASLRQWVDAARIEWIFQHAETLAEAIRRASPRRLQMAIEAGDGWARFRVAGDPLPAQFQLVQSICQRLRATYPGLEVDTTAAPALDSKSLLATASGEALFSIAESR